MLFSREAIGCSDAAVIVAHTTPFCTRWIKSCCSPLYRVQTAVRQTARRWLEHRRNVGVEGALLRFQPGDGVLNIAAGVNRQRKVRLGTRRRSIAKLLGNKSVQRNSKQCCCCFCIDEMDPTVGTVQAAGQKTEPCNGSYSQTYRYTHNQATHSVIPLHGLRRAWKIS